MRLSGIKLAGFKSFVDPTPLPLPSNLTSVVGPNGCGKSNIIDAVRWVLGETSIKNLRGSDSEDVIFNGSRTRKPAGRASVELLFDNADHQITGPYAAYSEIAVRRELTRDGGSQYYLNGAKCLKRDVTDLFLGTGLGGKNQYAIIEQGMVSRMVEAKPEELRQWLEEAAGISKYKERRRETESRIRGARDNLARVNDLQLELHGRLEVLAKQAADAGKYKNFKEQERRLKAELLLLRLRALDAQAAAHEASIAELEAGLEAARQAVTEAEAARDQSETAQREAGHALNAEQGQLYEAEATLARHEQSLAHARELQAMRRQELDRLESQLAELGRRREQEQGRHEALSQAVAAAEARVGEAQMREQAAQEQSAAAEAALIEEQRRWEEFSQRSQSPLLEAEGERVRVQNLERNLVQSEERLRRLQGELRTLDASPIQESLFEAESALESLERELAEAQERLQQADQELQALRDRRTGLEAELHEARQQLSGARGRQASLETLQKAALQQDDAELTNWLRERGLAGLPRLASALQVEPGWEDAVEHVLESWLQAPLVEQYRSHLPPSIDGLPRSGAAFLHAAPGAAAAAGDALAAKVSGPAALLDLLNGIFIADSREAAEQRSLELAPGESVITREGLWFGHNWLRAPKRSADHSGVIARGLQLKQLQAQIAELARTAQGAEQALNETRSQQLQQENLRRALSQRFDQTRAQQAKRLAERQAQAVRLEQVQARSHNLAREVEGLGAQRAQQTGELEQARVRLARLQQTAAQLQAERGERNRSLVAAREAVQQARAAAQQAAQQRSQAQIQLAGQTSALAAVGSALQSLSEQRAALEQQRAARQNGGEDLAQPIETYGAEVERAKGQVSVARARLRAARETLEAAERAVQEVARRQHETENQKDLAQERLQQARLEFENLRARREEVESQFGESHYTRAELAATLSEDASVAVWEEELARVTRRIDRLGAINLAAIQELDEARQREAYLAVQHKDVSEALATLEEAMRKLDAETQARFKETFDRVNDIFKARFPQLFGGGEAYLELTGADQTAQDSNWGVRVMARPPGKRNSTIQLLSGGEKAMTAVALLLGLFQLNPAPFCLMDEVDAPLDDANVGRFTEVVREMAQHVQFIIITHNKITMELAEQLHGVTMQEPGVSRLVSVDVQQAVQLAGADGVGAQAGGQAMKAEATT